MGRDRDKKESGWWLTVFAQFTQASHGIFSCLSDGCGEALSDLTEAYSYTCLGGSEWESVCRCN